MDKKVDWKPFCLLMESVGSITANPPTNPNSLAIMFITLSKYSFKEVNKAVFSHIQSKNGKFYPTPSDIIGIIEGFPEDKAEEAWQVLLDTNERLNGGDSIAFPNLAYHYAIQRMGGWPMVSREINAKEGTSLSFYGQDFKKFYIQGLKNANQENTELYLKGKYELENEINGYDHKIPIISIGKTGSDRYRELATQNHSHTHFITKEREEEEYDED